MTTTINVPDLFARLTALGLELRFMQATDDSPYRWTLLDTNGNAVARFADFDDLPTQLANLKGS